MITIDLELSSFKLAQNLKLMIHFNISDGDVCSTASSGRDDSDDNSFLVWPGVACVIDFRCQRELLLFDAASLQLFLQLSSPPSSSPSLMLFYF